MSLQDLNNKEMELYLLAQDILARGTTTQEFSNMFFAPEGKLRELWTTKEEKEALIKGQLFKWLQEQLAALRQNEAGQFAEAILNSCYNDDEEVPSQLTEPSQELKATLAKAVAEVCIGMSVHFEENPPLAADDPNAKIFEQFLKKGLLPVVSQQGSKELPEDCRQARYLFKDDFENTLSLYPNVKEMFHSHISQCAGCFQARANYIFARMPIAGQKDFGQEKDEPVAEKPQNEWAGLLKVICDKNWRGYQTGGPPLGNHIGDLEVLLMHHEYPYLPAVVRARLEPAKRHEMDLHLATCRDCILIFHNLIVTKKQLGITKAEVAADWQAYAQKVISAYLEKIHAVVAGYKSEK